MPDVTITLTPDQIDEIMLAVLGRSNILAIRDQKKADDLMKTRFLLEGASVLAEASMSERDEILGNLIRRGGKDALDFFAQTSDTLCPDCKGTGKIVIKRMVGRKVTTETFSCNHPKTSKEEQ